MREKIEAVAAKVYRADGVTSRRPPRSWPSCARMGYGDLPVCIAKTQYSFSDNAKALGAARELPHHRARASRFPPAPALWSR